MKHQFDDAGVCMLCDRTAGDVAVKGPAECDGPEGPADPVDTAKRLEAVMSRAGITRRVGPFSVVKLDAPPLPAAPPPNPREDYPDVCEVCGGRLRHADGSGELLDFVNLRFNGTHYEHRLADTHPQAGYHPVYKKDSPDWSEVFAPSDLLAVSRRPIGLGPLKFSTTDAPAVLPADLLAEYGPAAVARAVENVRENVMRAAAATPPTVHTTPEMPARRYKILLVPYNILPAMFRAFVLADPRGVARLALPPVDLPPGVGVVSVNHDVERGCFALTLYHPTWDVVPFGTIPPFVRIATGDPKAVRLFTVQADVPPVQDGPRP